jgi:hypothetical protein
MLQEESDGACAQDELPSSSGAGAKGCACIRDVRAELDGRQSTESRRPRTLLHSRGNKIHIGTRTRLTKAE